MKKILLITLLLIVGCSKEKEPINFETLINRDLTFFTKDTNIPYSGKVFYLFENGKKSGEGNFKNGKIRCGRINCSQCK